MPEYLQTLEQQVLQRWPNHRSCVFGHLGDGNLHLQFCIDSQAADEQHELELIVYRALQPFNGSISAEHGIGTQKMPYLSCSRSNAELALMRQIKQVLDPRNTLNPGRLLGDQLPN
jgi:FAD/FMN-containing dehydrogenase